MKKFLLTATAIMGLAAVAQAQTFTGEWLPTGATNGVTSTAAGFSQGAFTRGSGAAFNAGGTFNSNGFNSAGLAAAISANDYISFTLTIPANVTFAFSTMDIRLDRSGTGPASFAVLSSVTGFTSANSLWDSTTLAESGTPYEGQDISDVAGTTSSAQAVEFRVYAWGGSSAAGTFDIEALSSGSAAVLNGSVAAVPEPGVVALVALGGGFLLLMRRRKAKTA